MESNLKRSIQDFLVKGLTAGFLFFLTFGTTAADQEIFEKRITTELESLQSIFTIKFSDEQVEYQRMFLQLAQTNGLSFDSKKKIFNIVYVESGWRQYDRNGNVLSGKVHPPDKGLGQINTEVHKCEWKTPKDNLECVISIFLKSGTVPWNASKKMWTNLL